MTRAILAAHCRTCQCRWGHARGASRNEALARRRAGRREGAGKKTRRGNGFHYRLRGRKTVPGSAYCLNGPGQRKGEPAACGAAGSPEFKSISDRQSSSGFFSAFFAGLCGRLGARDQFAILAFEQFLALPVPVEGAARLVESSTSCPCSISTVARCGRGHWGRRTDRRSPAVAFFSSESANNRLVKLDAAFHVLPDGAKAIVRRAASSRRGGTLPGSTCPGHRCILAEIDQPLEHGAGPQQDSIPGRPRGPVRAPSW